MTRAISRLLVTGLYQVVQPVVEFKLSVQRNMPTF
jgi:hypothetical protein